MSDLAQKPINDPDLSVVLDNLKLDIMKSFRCVMVGKIFSYDSTKKTAKVDLMFKQVVNDASGLNGQKTISYPQLYDCPVFHLQGGGGIIDIDPQAGDECIVIFSDRNLEPWYSTGQASEPNDSRFHDLADGIAIVGINSLGNSPDALLLRLGFKDGKVVFKNAAGTLLSVIEGFVDVVKALTTDDGHALSAASILALETYKASFEALLHS